MIKKMIINATEEEEIRVAIVEDGVLQELDIQSTAKQQFKGNIYKGKVSNLEQGLQAAFVDFYGGKPGFLSMGEVQPLYWGEKTKGGRRRVQDVLKRGQEILVQVTKDEIGGKGAALTTYVSLPGRYLVLMPGSDTTGISRKIEDEKKRKRLKEIMSELDLPPDIGVIVRTAGLDRTKSEIAKDFSYLLKLWETIEQKAKEAEAPALIYQDLDVIIRAIRDYFSTDIKEVLIDDPEVHKQAKAFFADVMPRYSGRVKLYSERKPLFTKYELEKQIETIYKRKILLKGGGSIVIEPTEAMVTIDVNSGRGIPSKGIEETAYQTNLEAAREIARQLRLRDLGGLVVIDFIDMKDRKHKVAVEREFKAAVKPDKARTQISSISRLGLMELSRQRLRSPLWDVSFKPCPACHGQGVVKSTEALSMNILRRIHEAASRGNLKAVRGIMSTSVAEYLLNRKRRELVHIETEYDVKVALIGTTEILESDYDLEFVLKEQKEKAEEPKAAPPPRVRRRRRRGGRKAEEDSHREAQGPAEQGAASGEAPPVHSEGEEKHQGPGINLVRRLRPFRWWPFGEEEPSHPPVEAPPPPKPPEAAPPSEPTEAAAKAEDGGEPEPDKAKAPSSGRHRRSRYRGSRRRPRGSSGRKPAGKAQGTEGPPPESSPPAGGETEG